jgi:hypothetical protein
VLACNIKSGRFGEPLAYSPAKRKAIRDARKAEGWVYSGDALVEKKVGEQKVIVLEQGAEVLERLLAPASGDVFAYEAERVSDGRWNLAGEELVIDGIPYSKRYVYDAAGRLAQERVTYQARGACDHVIGMTAEYVRGDSGVLASVRFKGGYTGLAIEGTPTVAWEGSLAFAYDDKGRLAREEFVLSSFTKSYAEKPRDGRIRDEVKDFYPTLKWKKPLDIMRTGDYCGTSGTQKLANRIDLRPFYTVSPSFPTLLPPGVAKMTVDYTYPESFGAK